LSFALGETTPQLENLILPDADASLHHNFLTTQQAGKLLSTLIIETPWRQDHLTFGGRKVAIPRLQAWIGDASKNYGYSGLQLNPLSWTPSLLKIKRLIEQQLDTEFNSVLLNYYRNGQDSVSWHSDDEKELGPDPFIASLSLGVSRRFELKHRHRKPTVKFKCQLDHGSLLVMGAGLQQNWLHQIPKQKEIIQPRVNLTFRKIIL
jgi:alkylated DNA repair dioxygenase AlkB